MNISSATVRVNCTVFMLSMLCACSPTEAPEIVTVDEPAARVVTIMTFNVQNLFDNHDDPNKD
ncbi:MAG: hypothetical protein IIA78_05390, partial [Proteobacteria bacterium]|nr:hypothetical protein [Pseudomonadota bacterium]